MIEKATPNVWFTGQLSRDRVLEFYRAADVFMLASQHETFGLAPLEAAATGTPMILSDLQVFQETFGHVCGSYLPAAATDEFVNHIERLVDDEILRRRAGSRACQAAAKYDASLVAEMTRAAYQSVKRRSEWRAARRPAKEATSLPDLGFPKVGCVRMGIDLDLVEERLGEDGGRHARAWRGPVLVPRPGPRRRARQ
jgi:hypothetical protein